MQPEQINLIAEHAMKNNIYFTTSSDGLKTEGIGAMAQYQIVC